MADIKKIRFIDFASMFVRTFFMQAVWNFKSLISIGFCFALVPVAKRICKNSDDYREFLQRHLGFFNAHPYFASYALGAIARLEETSANSDGDCSNIEKFKNALIGPLGAVGDQYFWLSIKPASLLFAVTSVVLLDNLTFKLIAVGVALLLYNVPHFYIRARGLIDGYREGYNIYKYIRINKYTKILVLYKVIGAMALGMLIGFKLMSVISDSFMPVIIFIMSIAIAYFIRHKKPYNYWPIFIPILLAIGAGLR